MSAAGRSSWLGWLGGSGPDAGLEVSAHRVTAVRLSRAGGQATIAAHATEPLPDGAITPALNAPNLVAREEVSGAVERVLGAIGSPRRVALVVPDIVAKVSLVRFESVPSRVRELDQLIRWQVRKAAPFPVESAQVSWTGGVELPGGGREFVVVSMRRDIAEEYESVCAAAGAHAGLLDLATFNLLNLVTIGDAAVRHAVPPEWADWLLVHLAREYSTLAIVRGDRLVFYRNRLADAEGHLSDLVHQTAMYYEDRLGGSGFSRVIVAGGDAAVGADVGELRQTLEGRLRSQVETLDVRRAATLTDRITATPELLAALAAPTGVVLRAQAA